ncbi:pericentrin isoform X1 [Thalassophryne amazonica]|uniref:pericentrin isoform X1 n=1 Tax=Thalassophryne amazonica TaxID=390379 RepID=UPI0014720DCA|nr:pericentrin isoform X1 [Thalassophryne amazonica]
MDEDERQRKLEAGRAKLASFRQKRAKSDSAGAAKKTQKRKGQNVAQNNRSTQDCHVAPALSSANVIKLNNKPSYEELQNQRIQQDQQEDQPPAAEQSPSPVEELQEEELTALTGKEQLKQLQQAVEKRDEIIAKLSANLQEAKASRDLVQLEAHSLTGQIQAMQKQLQQTTMGFLRIKSHSGVEVFNAHRQQNLPGQDSTDVSHKELLSVESLSVDSISQSSMVENFSTDGDTDTDDVLQKLKRELEEERKNSQYICAKLADARESLSLLEDEKRSWEVEREEREVQLKSLQTELGQLQTLCLEVQQYKDEKEKLNKEVLELRKRLQEEVQNAEKFGQEVSNSASRLQRLQEEKLRQEEEMRMLGEEVETVKQLLQEREEELKLREEEITGLKASKNMQNQVKADLNLDEEIILEEANLENWPDQESTTASMPGYILMERYLSSVHPAHSETSAISESLEQSSMLDNSENYSFELNSEVLGDGPVLSISHCLNEEHNIDILQHSPDAPLASGSSPQSLSQWLNSVGDVDELEKSRDSEQQREDVDLAKELLSQQFKELHEELAFKDRDLNVLQEEVVKSAEELEEARNRWAQVTEELRQALWELEEEKEKRRLIEGEMNMKAHEQDSLKNKSNALSEEGQTVKAVFLLGKEDETSQLFLATNSGDEDKLVGEQNAEETVHPPPQNHQELVASSLLDIKQGGEYNKMTPELTDDNQLQELKDHCDRVMSELEETKARHKSAEDLLTQKSVELISTIKELETSHAKVLDVQMEVDRLLDKLEKSQSSLTRAEEEKHNLEFQILCLQQNLANLEESQARVIEEREEHRKKEEEMDGRIKKMEQVLEEELEQFEELLKAKDVELTEEREKWEEERQEKQKELLDIRHLLEAEKREREVEVKAVMERQALAIAEVTDRLRDSHQQEIKDLLEKHRQEISELKTQQEKELLDQKNSTEEQQTKQILLIKQVTEREHERMMLELTAKHSEEINQMRSKISSELIESLEVAHQAELQQIQEQNQNLEKRVCELLQSTDELKQQWEAQISQERASMEEMQSKEIQTLQSKWEEENKSSLSNLQSSLSETENSLASTRAEFADNKNTLLQTNKALNEVQEALSHTELELQQSEARLEEFQTLSKEHEQKLQEELKQAWADRDAAACALEELVHNQKSVLLEKEQQVHRLEEKKEQLQQKQVVNLQEEKVLLKQSSKEEMSQLQIQLESMRTSRQELGELKKQLLARSSCIDDIERLKMEFNEQKQEIKQQNEAELESLRRYFEQRLQSTEESYREEIALLQLKLVENALEETVTKTTGDSFISIVQADEEKSDSLCDTEKCKDVLGTLRLQLEEKHRAELEDLRTSLTLSFKEELQQVRSHLTDHYCEDLQKLKTQHALEVEQLRARLSESHLQELTRVSLEAERQAELEVEQRMWQHAEELQTKMIIIQTLENTLSSLNKQHDGELQRNTQQSQCVDLENTQKQEKDCLQEEMQRLVEELREKYEAQLSVLRADLEREAEEKINFEKQLQEEKMKLNSVHSALNNKDDSIVNQKLNQFDSDVQSAKSCNTAEIKHTVPEQLQQDQQKLQEEKAALEKCLTQKYEQSVAALLDKHQAELECERTLLQNKHSQEMAALCDKLKAELNSVNARHRDQLAALAVELELKHKTQLVALEVSLNSKRNTELASLEADLQETSQTRLEALEAALSQKHQQEKDELEKRMLGNMDTLETTYLNEVQTLRDEIVQLKERHQQDLNRQEADHVQRMEHHSAEQLSIREELRKQAAQVQVEKFSALAAELKHVHNIELAAQKEALDAEHCKALEMLKNQVLELEQQHGTAFQELSLNYAAEKELLKEQHQLQLQELRAVSARELEACRRELEEESSRQRQHFLEEVELLRVQSEEKLLDRINQLKSECEEQKIVALEELRRGFTSEQEETERSYTDKMNQLTAQMQQLDALVAQLRTEISCLQGELKGKSAEMETMETLLQRRERESQEGGNLLKMLTDDMQTIKEERHKLHQANEKFRKILLDIVRSTITTEELIGQRISTRAKTSKEESIQRTPSGNKNAQESGISVADLSSDDLELTQMLCESLLVSDAQISPGGEEAALNACSRLQYAVETLLELLNQANTQLEKTHDSHISLEEKLSQGKEDSAKLIQQHKLLLEQLDHEAKLKSQLQLELHKAEGLLGGYVAEKAALEESLQQKEAQEERLAEELEHLKKKLHQVEGVTAELDNLKVKHQELSEEHTILLQQRDHLAAGLNDREKTLLAETEHLERDKLDLQRQAEKDRSSLSLHLRALEKELEDHETKDMETELHHKKHTEDLHQRVQALEKQLKHNRQFIEEQAVEREHERDEFQQEICKLEAQLRHQAGGDNKGHKVESLQAIIKDKTEDHESLLAANQEAQRDLAEQNEEIDKLAGRIRDLEQALLSSAESKSSILQLEQELHRVKLREQEFMQDKQALEQQQLANRLQISALQSKLDETRHCYHDNTHDPTQELRDALNSAQQNLQSKEQEIEVLLGQLDHVQKDLNIKEVELKHLTLQLELLTNQNAAHVNELQEEIAALKETVSTFTLLKEEREGRREVVETEEETLPSALLQEKNQEIDHLNSEIHKLEQELQNSRDNKALEAELEDLHSQVEHLKSEIVRVRQDKQEEEERLHEVISTLQAELATLGPNLHEVSDSQDGDSINLSPSPSPEPQTYTVQQQTQKEGPNNLKQELSLSHSASSRSLHSHVKALQSQLDTVVAEKEALEQLLLTQEEEYRGHGEELCKELKTEREKAEELQDLLTLKEAELKEVKAKMVEETEKRKLSDEEKDSWKAKAQESCVLQEEKAHLSNLVMELEKKELESGREIDALKTSEELMKKEMKILNEASLNLERQIQEVMAEVVEKKQLIAEEKAKVDTLETVKEKLSAECEALRRNEAELQEEMERLRKEVTSMAAQIQDLTVQLNEKGASQEEAQKEVLSNNDALRQKEAELVKLEAELQALKAELSVVKEALSTSKEAAEKLLEEIQTKDLTLTDLENDNQQLKTEVQGLQEDLAVQEEELVYHQRELQQLRISYHQQETLPQQQRYSQKDISLGAFEDGVSVSHEEASLSSPEVLRRLECSEDKIHPFHTSVLGSRLSDLSALNSPGYDLPTIKTSPRVVMEPQHSRTVTPDPATRTTHSPGSVSGSDNMYMLDSLDTDKVHESDALDGTAPSSPLGSSSSLSAPEWASDGYGSNVSSELGARLRLELEQTERLDAQFVEYLRCRGMNPTANTDSAAGSMSHSEDLLSPEIQGLLKRVYQESCRILTLSQRRATSSTQPCISNVNAVLMSQTQNHSGDGSTLMNHHNKSFSHPPMTWQQEKRALQETVVALRELLCRMAQRTTQTDSRSEGVWDRHQPPIDRQIETQLRAELEENQKELKCAHDIQQEQKNKIQSLRLAIEDAEESLRKKQTRVQELQQQLEQERNLILSKEQEELEKREAIQVSLEQQRSEVVALQGQLEQERVACSNLRREIQIEQSRSMLVEKHLADTEKELQDERQRSTQQKTLSIQEKSHLEHLLSEAESRFAEIQAKLGDAHRRLDEERDRFSRQLDEVRCRHEADAARDSKVTSDLRAQLEQERRQGQELAAVADKLRADLLQSRRRLEEEEKMRREELHREQEVAIQLRVAMEALKEQKEKTSHALERERSKGKELLDLQETVHLLKEKEREREEQCWRDNRKKRKEQQERTNSNLCELELLRQQDQQHMKELQHTLMELEREEREMAAQRLCEVTTVQPHKASQHHESNSQTNDGQDSSNQNSQQIPPSSPNLLEKMLKENSELAVQVTTLNKEITTLKHTLTCLERQLHRAENELAKVTTETENRPINDMTSHGKMQRMYGRYLRAESYRKALVYQKRYLLLLLGGFQDCEQATLCLLAQIGARPSPQLSSKLRPLRRFRATVRVIIAVSRMKFLTRKWQTAVKRLSPSGNVHAQAQESKVDVLREQQSNSSSWPNRDTGAVHRETVSLRSAIKSPLRLHNRSYPISTLTSGHNGGTAQDPEQSLMEYIRHLEHVQQRLVGGRQGSSVLHSDPKTSNH